MDADFNIWLKSHPEITSLRLAVSDLNGVPRGKRIPSPHGIKAFAGGVRMPLSALNVDIWGADIADSPLVFASGDADGTLFPTGRGIVPMPWLDSPGALLPLWMSTDDGHPFVGDARHALNETLQKFAARNLHPVVAMEMEFYLLDGHSTTPRPPQIPGRPQRPESPDILSLAGLDAFEAFFTDLYATCKAMRIPADAASSEAGPGQFEINLLHGDAMKAADDAWLFKLAAKGVARKHGLQASFMAKPYPDQPGNGLHTHISLLDGDGQNVFAAAPGPANAAANTTGAPLTQAIAGMLEMMRDSTLVFAPHGNSYHRLAPDSHAPTSVSWGHENRTTALRIPGGPAAARRIEHRVAGGDVNPYLMLAAILGAALHGIEHALIPPAETRGNAYEAPAPQLCTDWRDAIDTAATSARLGQILPSGLIDNLVRCKRQELARLAAEKPETRATREIASYLETV